MPLIVLNVKMATSLKAEDALRARGHLQDVRAVRVTAAQLVYLAST